MSINPFARWVGSKKQLLPELKRYMPTEYDNYFEPFFGGDRYYLTFALKMQL